jgi:hypothetical protein
MIKNTPASLLLLALTALLSAGAHADDSEIVLPAKMADASSQSGAEIAVTTEQAEAAQAAWMKELAEHPDNKLLVKANRKNAFANHPEKMRCWVYGFSAGVGVQSGVCKSAGRTYAMSALGLGSAAEIHTGRLKLVADRPFPEDHLGMTGVRASISVVLGFEEYSLSNQKSGTQVRGHGLGLGLGGGVEFVWLQLNRIDAPTPAPAPVLN